MKDPVRFYLSSLDEYHYGTYHKVIRGGGYGHDGHMTRNRQSVQYKTYDTGLRIVRNK